MHTKCESKYVDNAQRADFKSTYMIIENIISL